MRAGRRNIKPGDQFNHLFNPSKGNDIYAGEKEVKGTLDKIEQLVAQYNGQTNAFSEYLKNEMLGYWVKSIKPIRNEKAIKDASSALWNFLYHHVQYKIDTPGREELRLPNRLWADRKTGVDCDCYSLFISSVLTNLGINHALRITAYDGKPNFQHVYVIVPIKGDLSRLSKREDYIVIDPVLDQFNNEKSFTKKYDKIMAIPHYVLNGVGSIPAFGKEFNSINGLNGLGSVESVMEENTKAHLQNTFNLLAVNPQMYAPYFNVPVYQEQIAYALEHWDDPAARDMVLEELDEMEQNGELAPVPGEGVNGFFDRWKKKNTARTKVQLLRNRRSKNGRLIPATKRRGIINKIPQLNQIQREIEPQVQNIRSKIQNSQRGKTSHNNINPKGHTKMICVCNPALAGLSGLGSLGGFWNKVRNGVNKIKTVVNNVKDKVKNTTTKVKERVNQVVEKVKEVGGNIVKNNPVSWGIRKGMITAMSVNLFKMASRIAPAYLSDGAARSLGFDLVQLRALKKVLAKVEEMFLKIGGAKDELKAAVERGKNKFQTKNSIVQTSKRSDPRMRKNFSTMSGLGSVAIAAAAASAGPSIGIVAKITAFLKKINFKQLFAKVKNIAGNIKNKITSNVDIPDSVDFETLETGVPNNQPAPTRQNNMGTGTMPVPTRNSPPAPTEDTASDGLIEDPLDSSNNNNSGGNSDDDGKSSNAPLYIGGGIGLLALGYFMFKPKPSLNGLPVEVELD